MEIYLKHRIVGTIVVFAIVATIAPAIYSSRDNLFPNQLKSNIPVAPDYRLGLPYLTTKAALLENSPNQKIDNSVLVISLDNVGVKNTLAKKQKLSDVKVAEAETELKVMPSPRSAHSSTIVPKPIIFTPIESNSAAASQAVAPLTPIAVSPITNVDSEKEVVSKQQTIKSLVATKPKPLAATLPIIKPAAIIVDQPEITPSQPQKLASGWIVQLGSFSKKTNATNLLNKLREHGHQSFVEPITGKNGMVYRVRVGPESKQSVAKSLKNQLFDEVQVQGVVMSYP